MIADAQTLEEIMGEINTWADSEEKDIAIKE